MIQRFPIFILVLFLSCLSARAADEFRGAWVATVWNIDWPSRPGLSTAAQKSQLVKIMDQAQAIGLNTIIFQVRPAGDTFYKSPFEPWSGFLTGAMGRAPQPFYDPLAFAIEQAHQRGMQLHAWINPFRAQSGKYAPASNHLRRTKPEWVKRGGKELWIDPGIPEARAHVLKIVADLIRRYPVDGIHIDDYFYPYPSASTKPRRQNFPDSDSYKRYREAGGTITDRNEWRRQNINRFVQQLYQTIKRTDPKVVLGISPFGIWRPGFPESIEADLDAYEHICADSRLWLQNGWCDYFSPQLYWRIDQKEQSFPVLLNWWKEQNTKGVNLWPGVAPARIGKERNAQEIVRQIELTRQILPKPGHIHWSFSPLGENRQGIADLLKTKVYSTAVATK